MGHRQSTPTPTPAPICSSRPNSSARALSSTLVTNQPLQFETLRERRLRTDVCFVFDDEAEGDEGLWCHAIVLMAASPLFCAFFSEPRAPGVPFAMSAAGCGENRPVLVPLDNTRVLVRGVTHDSLTEALNVIYRRHDLSLPPVSLSAPQPEIELLLGIVSYSQTRCGPLDGPSLATALQGQRIGHALLEVLRKTIRRGHYCVGAQCTSRGGVVWGDGIYTSDSSVCAASVHAGLLTAAQGGLVLQMQLGYRNEFRGSMRNGISSSGYGHFEAQLITTPARLCAALNARKTCPWQLWEGDQGVRRMYICNGSCRAAHLSSQQSFSSSQQSFSSSQQSFSSSQQPFSSSQQSFSSSQQPFSSSQDQQQPSSSQSCASLSPQLESLEQSSCGVVWGDLGADGFYAAGSDLCLAARHCGSMQPLAGAENFSMFEIALRGEPGRGSTGGGGSSTVPVRFPSALRNGVCSLPISLPAHPQDFSIVVSFSNTSKEEGGENPSPCDATGLNTWRCRGAAAGCRTSIVYGDGTDDMYTDDSHKCSAARHLGIIGPEGGEFDFFPEEPRDNWRGSSRNGVTSVSWGGQWRSMRLVRSPNLPPAAASDVAVINQTKISAPLPSLQLMALSIILYHRQQHLLDPSTHELVSQWIAAGCQGVIFDYYSC